MNCSLHLPQSYFNPTPPTAGEVETTTKQENKKKNILKENTNRITKTIMGNCNDFANHFLIVNSRFFTGFQYPEKTFQVFNTKSYDSIMF